MATHELILTDLATKRFTSWDRGEHEREWAVLTRIHAHVPGLVPAPVRADLDASPPSVTMTVVPGVPLSGALTAGQFDALERALRRLWSVPVDGLPDRRYRPQVVVDLVRRDFTRWPARAGVVGEAMTAATDHLARYAPVAVDRAVLGHSDPNLNNYLFDGDTVRIVDFEDAGRSDQVYELATLVEHRNARDTGWEEFLGRFPVDPGHLLIGRRLNAILWLHTLLLVTATGRDVPPGALDRQAARVLTLISASANEATKDVP